MSPVRKILSTILVVLLLSSLTVNGKKKEPLWPTQPGEGVDLDKLDQCLEKNLRYYRLGESLEELNKEFQDIPLIRENTLFNGPKRNKGYGTGAFGSSTTWTISKSKHLCYMLIQKVGSMSFREMLSLCDEDKNIPCDVLNSHWRPWRAIDARPNYRENGGFYANNFAGPSQNDGDFRSVNFPHDFKERIDDCVRFTYVSDPIAHISRGYRQLHHGHDKSYAVEYERFLEWFSDPQRERLGVNIHLASPMVHLFDAAQESTLLAREKGENIKYKRPFDFIGRLEYDYTDEDWAGILGLVEEKYPQSRKYLLDKVVAENEGDGLPLTPEKVKALKEKARKEKLSTLLRQYNWGIAHAKSKKFLGPFAHVDTMPREITRKLCAAYYADYICLGRKFPSQCTDKHGNYNVSEYPLL